MVQFTFTKPSSSSRPTALQERAYSDTVTVSNSLPLGYYLSYLGINFYQPSEPLAKELMVGQQFPQDMQVAVPSAEKVLENTTATTFSNLLWSLGLSQNHRTSMTDTAETQTRMMLHFSPQDTALFPEKAADILPRCRLSL